MAGAQTLGKGQGLTDTGCRAILGIKSVSKHKVPPWLYSLRAWMHVWAEAEALAQPGRDMKQSTVTGRLSLG